MMAAQGPRGTKGRGEPDEDAAIRAAQKEGPPGLECGSLGPEIV